MAQTIKVAAHGKYPGRMPHYLRAALAAEVENHMQCYGLTEVRAEITEWVQDRPGPPEFRGSRKRRHADCCSRSGHKDVAVSNCQNRLHLLVP